MLNVIFYFRLAKLQMITNLVQWLPGAIVLLTVVHFIDTSTVTAHIPLDSRCWLLINIHVNVTTQLIQMST